MIVRGTKIGNGHIKYPVVKNAFSKYGIDVDDNSKNAQIVWYDGTIPFDFFYTILPYQRLNKIPNMDFICFIGLARCEANKNNCKREITWSMCYFFCIYLVF